MTPDSALRPGLDSGHHSEKSGLFLWTNKHASCSTSWQLNTGDRSRWYPLGKKNRQLYGSCRTSSEARVYRKEGCARVRHRPDSRCRTIPRAGGNDQFRSPPIPTCTSVENSAKMLHSCIGLVGVYSSLVGSPDRPQSSSIARTFKCLSALLEQYVAVT